MTEGEPPSGDRPRWSFTWLLRIQRVGRNRAVEAPGDGRQRRTILYVMLGGIIIIEVAFGLWLGILPR